MKQLEERVLLWLEYRIYSNYNKNHTNVEMAYAVSKRLLVTSLALFCVVIITGL